MREQAREPLDEISTHDLVQPLTAIKMQAQMAARHLRSDDASVTEAALALDAIAERAGMLAEDVAMQLLATDGEHGLASLHDAPCDLVALLRAAIRGFEPSERARIIVTAPESLVGRWDGERIIQVARNLVGNALKYSAPDGIIRVSVSVRADAARMDVADDGIGLNADEMAQLFTRRYRSPRVVAGGIGGVGLGLSWCRAIVEAHGGTISPESDGEGRGARFRVTLPLFLR